MPKPGAERCIFSPFACARVLFLHVTFCSLVGQRLWLGCSAACAVCACPTPKKKKRCPSVEWYLIDPPAVVPCRAKATGLRCRGKGEKCPGVPRAGRFIPPVGVTTGGRLCKRAGEDMFDRFASLVPGFHFCKEFFSSLSWFAFGAFFVVRALGIVRNSCCHPFFLKGGFERLSDKQQERKENTARKSETGTVRGQGNQRERSTTTLRRTDCSMQAHRGLDWCQRLA